MSSTSCTWQRGQSACSPTRAPCALSCASRGKHAACPRSPRSPRQEITFPGPAIDRAHRDRWEKGGRLTLRQRAGREVERLVAGYAPSRLAEPAKADLTRLVEAEGRRRGMERLPAREP